MNYRSIAMDKKRKINVGREPGSDELIPPTPSPLIDRLRNGRLAYQVLEK